MLHLIIDCQTPISKRLGSKFHSITLPNYPHIQQNKLWAQFPLTKMTDRCAFDTAALIRLGSSVPRSTTNE